MTNELYEGTVFLLDDLNSVWECAECSGLTCTACSASRALMGMTAGSRIIHCFEWNSLWPSRHSSLKLDITVSMSALLEG